MTPTARPATIPLPGPIIGLAGLRAMWQRRGVIGAFEAFHRALGDVFRLPLPGFSAVVLAGPEAARFLMVTARDDLRWRIPADPITRLLRHGVLVEDGTTHDALRAAMSPPLHAAMLRRSVSAMLHRTDQVSATWPADVAFDLRPGLRQIAVLVMGDVLFGADLTPDLARLWRGVLHTLRYVSPGPWVLWRPLHPLTYSRHINRLDSALYHIIAARRRAPTNDSDLLGALIAAGLTDDLIRDQMMTMIVAAQDTSAALASWALALLGRHPATLHALQAEVRGALHDEAPTADAVNRLPLLKAVLNETMRLYPPIHIGSRVAAHDLTFNGYRIAAGERLMFSIYLTHRHPAYWDEPHRFRPERFRDGTRQTPYTFLPFGGGPRNCIGAALAQLESRVVLARLLQRFHLTPVPGPLRPHMGATLEPRPAVRYRIKMPGPGS